MNRKKPLLTIRPVFDTALTVAESALAGIAGAAVAVFLLATFAFIVLSIVGLGSFVSAGFLYQMFFLLGIAGAPALYFELKRAAYRRTAFLFYDDTLEYQDFRFLISRRRGRVRLIDITDVFEKATLLQSRRVLTSLYLVVPGMPMGTSRTVVAGAFTGVKIPDVPENSGLHDRIVDLIQDANRRWYQQPAAPAPMPVPAHPPAPAEFQAQPNFQPGQAPDESV